MVETIVMIHGMWGGSWYWENYKAVSTYKEFPNHAHWVIGEPDWQEIANYASEWLNQAIEKDMN